MTESDVIRALRAKFAPPEYAFFGGVANGTGRNFSRTADALAMSLWPSRGLELIGMEVKVSRGDWLRELKNPQKAESIVRRCDRWYLVVADRTIVQPGELPPTWGLMVVSGGRVKVVAEAPALEKRPIDREFLAALLRRAHESCNSETELRNERQAGYEAGYADGKKLGESNAKLQVGHTQRDLEQLRNAVTAFEEASGVKLVTYRAGYIGEAVRFVLDGGMQAQRLRLIRMRQEIQQLHEFMQALDFSAETEGSAKGSEAPNGR